MKLPKGTKMKVAKKLLARFFATPGATVYKGFYEWASRKGALKSHHVVDALPFAKTADTMVGDPRVNLLDSESLELVMRKLYAVMKAYEEVTCEADWSRPANAKATWESKVREDLIPEYDFLVYDGTYDFADDVADAEVGQRLKSRALITKHLTGHKKI